MRFPGKAVAAVALATAAVVGALAQEARYSDKGADTCLACHDDELTLTLFRTRHAMPSDPHGPFGPGELQCEACHGPGDAHAGRVRRGQERPPILNFDEDTPVDVQNGMCIDCHADDTGTAWHSGPHAARGVACTDCHSSHIARDPVLAIATEAEVCFTCHRRQRAEMLRAFSHPVDEAKMACTSCHAPHGEAVATSLVRATVNDTCFGCHAEKRGPFLWEHAPAVEDCGLCHAAHGSNHSGMLTRRGPLLCQSCHTQAGHPAVAYDTSGLPAGMPSQFLLGQNCMNCHSQVHGSNHPSGSKLMR